MTTLLWGSLITGAAFLLHILIWRLRVPVRQTRALLLMFGGVLAMSLTGLAAVPDELRLHLPIPDSLPDFLHITLFVIACTLAYVITYSAVEADSPTLVMARAIDAAGPEGLDATTFRARMSDDLLVKPRLADLVRDGLLRLDGNRYDLTPRGRRFVGIFVLFRRLLGAGKGG